MIIAIQNTIGAIGRGLGIVTRNLQMWIDFTKANVIGSNQFVLDKSTNTNNAKLFTGKALSFDGVNDYIENSSMLTASKNASTLSFSIKNTGSSGGEGFIGNSTTNQHYLSISSSNLILRASGTMVFSYSFSLNTWYRISIVRFDDSGTSKTSIYVDDVLTSTIVNEFDFQFNRFGESTSGSYGKVLLSDIQLYNTAWTSDDVAFDYANPNNLVFNNSASSISVSNLKGYYALSEGSGSIAYDSSGEGNNGAITGATYDDKQPTIPQLGMMDWSNASGKTLIEAPKNIGYDILGNALRLRDGGFNLDGIGYAEVASNSSLTNITGGTIQFWLKTSDTKFSVLNGQSSSEFIGKTDNGVWSFGNAGTITSYIGSDTASTQPLYNDAWNFYTFTGVNLSTWNEFYTSNLAGFDIDGIIDEVLIYSSVLSAKEIKNNYKIGLSKHS